MAQVVPGDSDSLASPHAAAGGWLVAFTVYLVAAVVYFAVPIAATFNESLLGTKLFGPDNYLNAAILEWGHRAALSGALDLFDWPAGYPLRNTLAGTEHLAGWQTFFLPQRLAGVGIVAAYNVSILISLIISGITANLLARQLGVDRHGALVAGFVFAFAPQHIGLMVQFQSMAICWLPLGIAALERVLGERGVGNIVALAATVIMAALGSMYYGVFLVFLLALWYGAGLVLRRFQPSLPAFGRVAIAAVVALGVLLPVSIEYARVSSTFGFDRTLENAIERSMGVADFFMLPNWLLVWRETPLRQRIDYGAAFPGFVLLALLAFSLRWKAAPRLKLMLFGIAVLCAVLSLGPRLKIFNYPTSYLVDVPMPGAILGFLPGLRMPSRLLPCAFIFLAVLAGGGASVLINRRPERRGLVLALLLVAAAIDVYPAPAFARDSWRISTPLATSDAYGYLASAPDTSAIVEVPLSDSTGFTRPATAAYVYGSVGHLRRTVSYDLSVKLPQVDSLQAAAARLPDDAARQQLVNSGVGRVVVHHRFFKADSLAAVSSRFDQAGYPVLFRGKDATVYALAPAEQAGAGRQP